MKTIFKLLAFALFPLFVFADTPPQVINKQCSPNQYFSQIQPGAGNINCSPVTTISSGTPNTIAGFNSLGFSESIPQWSFDPSTRGGFAFQLNTQTDPAPDTGPEQYFVNSTRIQVVPSANTTNVTANVNEMNVSIDPGNTGFQIGSDFNGGPTVLSSYDDWRGNGHVGVVRGVNLFFDMLGNSGGTIDHVEAANFSSHIGSGVTNGDQTLMGLSFQNDAGSVGNFITGLNISGGMNGTLNQNFQGISINPTFTGNAVSFSAYATNPDMTNTILSSGLDTYDSFGNYHSGVTVAFSNLFNEGSHWYSGSTITSNISSFNSGPTIDPGASVDTYNGVNIAPNGSGTVNHINGINMNLSNLLSPNQKVGLSINDGTINSGGNFDTALTPPPSNSVYGINNIGGEVHIAPGSPLTNQFGFGNNFATNFFFEDDVPADFTTLHLGYTSVAFVGQIAGVAGKRTEDFNFGLAGAGIPSASTGGTITNLNYYRAIGLLPEGGTLNVDNQYGFRIDPLFDSVATNSWAIYIDANAHNYMGGDLAIGTSSKKVSNSSVAFEVGGTTKAIKLPLLTTTQRNALTALESMEIYNTTTKEVEFYDGTSWQSGGGGGGVTTIGTIDSQAPSSDGAVIVGSSLYMQSANGTNPGLVNNTTQSFSGNKSLPSNSFTINGVSVGSSANSVTGASSVSSSGQFTLNANGSNLAYQINTAGQQGFNASPQSFAAFLMDTTGTQTTTGTVQHGLVVNFTPSASATQDIRGAIIGANTFANVSARFRENLYLDPQPEASNSQPLYDVNLVLDDTSISGSAGSAQIADLHTGQTSFNGNYFIFNRSPLPSRFSGALELLQQTTPSNPNPTLNKLYFKSDNNLYMLNSSGVETLVSTGGSVTSVTASSPLASSGGVTPNITIQVANGSQNGYLSSTDWNTFNNKQSTISLSAVGGSPNANAATFSSNVLNLEYFSSSFPGVVAASGGGTTNFLRADGTWASPSAGAGNVSGPGSSTNTAIARWNGTAGNALLDSGVLIDGSNNVSGVSNLTVNGVATLQGGIAFANTHVCSTSCSVGANDTIILTTQSGAINVTLPTATDGRILIIKDRDGAAAVSNITLLRSGSDVIDGATSFVLNANYESVTLSGSSGHWSID